MYRSICQSCSLQLHDYDRGSEANGALSSKYCSACYAAGSFRDPNISLADMEDRVATILRVQKHWPALVAKIASRQIMNLERWSSQVHAQDSSNRVYS